MITAPRTVSFGAEYVVKVWPEILPLLEKHWEEIAHYKDIPLEPDFEQYKKLDDLKLLRVFTARREDVLIGYCVYMVGYNLHYKSSLQARQDVLFIDKKHRGFGGRFIAWCDEQLRKEGVQVVYHHVKEAHDFGSLLVRLGYEPVDKIYARRLI